MEDHDFQVVRKNLNILSVLILILAYTNAQLHEINFLGIDMNLSGTRLYQALFIGYVYFFWRFLTKLPLISGFWTDFLQYYLVGEHGVKQKYNYEKFKHQIIQNSERIQKAVDQKDDQLGLLATTVVRLQGWPLTKLRLSLNFHSKVQEQGQPQDFFETLDINVPRLFMIRKLFLFCVRYDKFGDYLFPIIPVILNVLLFFLDAQWQGSIYKIFSCATCV